MRKSIPWLPLALLSLAATRCGGDSATTGAAARQELVFEYEGLSCDTLARRCLVDCSYYVERPLVVEFEGYTFEFQDGCDLNQQLLVGARDITVQCGGGSIDGRGVTSTVPGRGMSGVVTMPYYVDDPGVSGCRGSGYVADFPVDGFTLDRCEVQHWTAHGVDLRRWAYARTPSGCEVSSVGYPDFEQLENMRRFEFACLNGTASCSRGEAPNGDPDAPPVFPASVQEDDFRKWWPDGVRIVDSYVHDVWGNGIFGAAYATDWVVEGRDGADPWPGTEHSMVVTDSGSVGIYIERESRGFTVRGALVASNGHRVREGAFWCREGIAIDSASGNLIETSEIRDNCAGGIFLFKNVGEPSGDLSRAEVGIPRRTRSDWNVIVDNRISEHPARDMELSQDRARTGVGVWIAARQGWSYSERLDELARGASDGNWYRLIDRDTYFRDWAMWNRIEDNVFVDNRVSVFIADRETALERNEFSTTAPFVSMHDVVVADKPFGLAAVPPPDEVHPSCFLEHWGLGITTTWLRHNSSSTVVAAGTGRQVLLTCAAGCNAGAASCSSMCGGSCFVADPGRVTGNCGVMTGAYACLSGSYLPGNECIASCP